MLGSETAEELLLSSDRPLVTEQARVGSADEEPWRRGIQSNITVADIVGSHRTDIGGGVLLIMAGSSPLRMALSVCEIDGVAKGAARLRSGVCTKLFQPFPWRFRVFESSFMSTISHMACSSCWTSFISVQE